MSDAETLDSLRRWLREHEDLLRVRDAEIDQLRRERDNARNERDVLVVTEEAHRALSEKTQAYFSALAAIVRHLHPHASLKELERWDPPWPQVAEALRR